MSKGKISLLISGGVLILALVVFGILSFSKKSQEGEKAQLPSLSLPTLQKEEVEGDLTYNDASGFSFKYPKAVKVNDITPDDQVYYTLLNLSKGGRELKISAKDTSFKNIEEWIKSEEGYRGSTLVGGLTLAEFPAKQYSLGSMILTAAIDKGVLYLIEGPKDPGFWEETQDLITSTFTFSAPQKPTSSSASGAVDNTIYEEEEIIE